MAVQLSKYNRSYHPGAGLAKRILWYLFNFLLFDSWLLPLSRPKAFILRLFGARVGKGVVIKPRVNIKYPWHLEIGDHVWIGEGVWIDNLTSVKLGSNACLSQEAYLLTGNHDYTDPAFSLILKEIVVEEGAWLGARSTVCPGVRVGRESVLAVGSVLQKDALNNGVYQGNPAERIRERRIANDAP